MYVKAYETSSLIYHEKPIYVCNRHLDSISPEIKSSKKQEFLCFRVVSSAIASSASLLLFNCLI